MSTLWPLLPYAEGETPMSFLSRLARLHGRTARRFCTELGLAFEQILDGVNDAIEKLASLGSVDFDVMASNAMVRAGFRKHVWRGEALSHLSVSRLAARICPRCIAEDAKAMTTGKGPGPHCRAIWQVTYVRTCPRHQVLLSRVDPPNFASRYDFLGTIDPILPQVARPDFPAVARATSEFERYLLDRIAGKPDPSCPWLNGLGFAAAADTCEAMGAVLAFGRKPGLDILDDAAWHLAGDLGFLVAREGPIAVREMLTAWDAGEAEGAGPGGIPTARWGTFRVFLNRQDNRSDLEPVRDVAFDHVVATTPVGPGDVVLRRTVTKRLIHSLKTASGETGLSVKALRSVLRGANVIDDSTGRRASKYVLFDAVQSEPILQAASQALVMHGVSKYLRIGDKEARSLVASGFIPAIVEKTNSTDVAVRAFAKSAIDAFIERLGAGAHPVRSWMPDTCSISRAASYAGCDSVQVVDLILRGAFSWVGTRVDQTGYKAIQVRVSELKRLISCVGREVLTLPEAAEYLDLTYNNVVRLLSSGLFKASPARGSGSGFRRSIALEEVRQFRQTYVTLGEVARSNAMHPKKCLNLMTQNGIKPVRTREDCTMIVFQRADITLLLD